MRARRSAYLAILLLAGCTHHIEEAGPAGIPYACADGKPARIFYAGGGYFPRASAHLVYDGREIASGRGAADLRPALRQRRRRQCADHDLVGARRGSLADPARSGPDRGARDRALRPLPRLNVRGPECGRFAAIRPPFSARTLTRHYNSMRCILIGRRFWCAGIGSAASMKSEMKSLSLGALLLCAAPAAWAQDSNAIGNPQLRDFQLRPQGQQPLTQPAQQAPAPVVVAPPPPVTVRPQAQPPAQQQQLPPPQAQPAQPGPAAAQRQQAPARPSRNPRPSRRPPARRRLRSSCRRPRPSRRRRSCRRRCRPLPRRRPRKPAPASHGSMCCPPPPWC